MRDIKSTNSYKFQNNLESRIYATLSKNIADQLFGEDETSMGDGEWYTSETPFGDSVSWMRENDRIMYMAKLVYDVEKDSPHYKNSNEYI